MDLSCGAIQYDEEIDDPESVWKPHEKALMMPMFVLPQTSSVFCETDYMVCKDFGSLHVNLRVQENPGEKKALEKKLEDARTMVKARYEKLKVEFVDPAPIWPHMAAATPIWRVHTRIPNVVCRGLG